MFEDKTFNTYGNKLRMDLVRGYIFDIKNAKAIWGEDENYEGIRQPEWQVRLKEMVLEEEPLKYLEKFIN